jgi:3-deoxy-D-manno-octulosonic-acid transferase
MDAMRRFLDVLYALILLLLSPWLLWRAWRTGRYRRGLREKLGGTTQVLPPGAVWFHGVSLGEMQVLRQLVSAFRRRHPATPVVVSSTTDTGLAEARKHFPDLPVIVFPLDFSFAVDRTFAQVRPALLVLCESELWPNLLMGAKKAKVPVALVNGRMSPRSLARYRLFSWLTRPLLRSLSLAAMQSDEYTAAMLALGVEPGKAVTTGNLKYDGASLDRTNPRSAALRSLFQITSENIVWVVGSTQTPEEEIAIRIFRTLQPSFPSLRLLLIPRHPDRFAEVAQLLHREGLAYVRRSSLNAETAEKPTVPAVVLVDSVGELGALWALADLAYVGGSLDGKRGGQNMIEPAAYGVAVTFGPHVWNFRQTAASLIEVGGAAAVRDEEELLEVTHRLLGDARERRAIGAAGRAFVLTQQGATERTLALLDRFLAKEEKQAA